MFGDLTEEELAKHLYDVYHSSIAKKYPYTPPTWEDIASCGHPSAEGWRALARELAQKASRL